MVVILAFYDFEVFGPSLLTLWINCFLYIYSIFRLLVSASCKGYI